MLFPIKDDQPTIRTPHVTLALIGINSLIFIFSKMLGPRGFAHLLIDFGYIPGLLFNSGVIDVSTTSVAATVVSSMFLHGGWMHLIGNMVFLWIFGNNIEDYFGPLRFLIFYLVSGFAAISIYTLFDPMTLIPLVGASGAIAGVMGAYMVLHPRARVTCLLFFFLITFITLPAKVVLGLWFAYQILMWLASSSSGGGVAWMAHVGGFLFGWLLLKMLLKMRGRGQTSSGGQRIYRVQW